MEEAEQVDAEIEVGQRRILPGRDPFHGGAFLGPLDGLLCDPLYILHLDGVDLAVSGTDS